MDSPNTNMVDASQLDLSKLSDRDKQELRVFIENESQKGRIQGTIHSLTDTCWKKCVPSAIKSNKLDKNEEACARNCVDRFLDANLTVIKHLEAMRHQQ